MRDGNAATTTRPAWPIASPSVNCTLIFFVTFAAYWPALGGGFIWDDAGHVTRADLRSLSGLARIWFEPGATQQYYPLLHSAFWIEHRLWGDAAFGYHAVNVLLHALSACLVGRLLQRLAVPGAWLAAFLFAVHPVCVESVAWIAEQKNTLSTALYLSAALAYLRFDETRRRNSYAAASSLFVAAVLTKTVTATLPAALLVVFWWRRGTIRRREDILPLLPWFAFGLSAGALTAWFERTLIGAHGADFGLSAVERVLLATRVPWFYLGKLIWPADLAFIYPRWTIEATVAWQYVFPVLTLGLLVGLWFIRARARGMLAAVLIFGGSLFPALGFFDVYPFVYSYVADHFQYLGMIALLALAAAGLSQFRLPVFISPVIIASLAVLSWRHSAHFRTAQTLYEDTLRKNPACWMAHNNLAILLVDQGRAADALPHYEAALRHRPNYAEGENNFGFALNALERPAEALPHFQRALQLRPNYFEAQNNLGVALMALGKTKEGEEAFRETLRLKPNHVPALLNLGMALARAGRNDEALASFQRARELDPKNAEAELYLGIARQVRGQFIDAVTHFSRALELRPDWGAGHFHLALALRQVGREDDARSHLRKAEEFGFRPPSPSR